MGLCRVPGTGGDGELRREGEEDGVGPVVVVVGDDDAFLEGAAVLTAEGEEASGICAGE